MSLLWVAQSFWCTIDTRGLNWDADKRLAEIKQKYHVSRVVTTQGHVLSATDLESAPNARGDRERTLADVLLAQTTLLTSIPAGRTAILVFHGMGGGCSNLEVWQKLADALQQFATVESFQRLNHELNEKRELNS